MKFEKIGGNSNTTQYSLYDYTEDIYGETVMSIEIHHTSKNWWFVGTPKSEIKLEHMKALKELLDSLIQ